MKKLVVLFVAVTVIVAAAILYFNHPESAPNGASLVPDSTIVFVDIPNFQASRANFATTPLYQLWQEREVQAFLEKPLKALHDAMNSSKQDSEFAQTLQKQLVNFPQGECFIALTHLSVSPEVKASVVIGADLKSYKRVAQGALKVYESQFLKENPQGKIEPKTWLGVHYQTWWSSPSQQLHQAFLGSMLVLATEEDAIRDVIARTAGQAAPEAVSLAASPRYQETLHELPAGRDAHLFVNVEQLVSDYGMLLLMASQSNPTLGGLTDMRAWAGSVTMSDSGITDVGVVTFAKNHQAAPSVQRHTLTAAPADSALYFAGRADLADGYLKLMDMLAKTGNPAAMQAGSQLDKFLSDAGVHLGDDFLAHLGPEVSYVGNWRPGARYPDFALVVEVKDKAVADKFDKIVAAVKKAVPTSEDIQQTGVTLHTIPTGSSYLVPTYVLTDKFFILALTDAYAKEIVAQSQGAKPSLVGSDSYNHDIKLLPAVGSSVTYCDLQKVIGGIYTLAKASATNADVNAALSLDKLPSTATITRHLGTLVSTTVVTEKNSVTTTHSALGQSATGIVGLAGVLVLAQPLLAQLPFGAIPGLPTTSSNMGAPLPPGGNQTATFQTPPN